MVNWWCIGALFVVGAVDFLPNREFLRNSLEPNHQLQKLQLQKSTYVFLVGGFNLFEKY